MLSNLKKEMGAIQVLAQGNNFLSAFSFLEDSKY